MDKIIEICDELRKTDYSLNKVMLMKKKLLDYINQDEDNKEDRILQLKVDIILKGNIYEKKLKWKNIVSLMKKHYRHFHS